MSQLKVDFWLVVAALIKFLIMFPVITILFFITLYVNVTLYRHNMAHLHECESHRKEGVSQWVRGWERGWGGTGKTLGWSVQRTNRAGDKHIVTFASPFALKMTAWHLPAARLFKVDPAAGGYLPAKRPCCQHLWFVRRQMRVSAGAWWDVSTWARTRGPEQASIFGVCAI